jgi:hypothetical protein
VADENSFIHQAVLRLVSQGDALAGCALENCSVIGYK